MTQTTYALDNRQQGAGRTLSWLAGVLDVNTKGILENLIPSGGRCLELGAGAGTISTWMADMVGKRGLVVATDLDITHVEKAPLVRIVEHDLRSAPLSALDIEDPDLIHARCLLAHLGNRDELVGNLAGMLAPGGHLVIEEWGGYGPGQVLCSPFRTTEELYGRYQQALMAVLRSEGNDGTWLARVHRRMVEAGLETRTFARARSWPGKTPGCKLPRSLSVQIEDKLVKHGISRIDLVELRKHLDDPNVVLLSNLTVSTIGRKADV